MTDKKLEVCLFVNSKYFFLKWAKYDAICKMNRVTF